MSRIPGVYPASQIVGWYNGHPDHDDFTPDFGEGRVCIFGHGNVAVDLARILLCPPEVLAPTDISQNSLELLKSTQIREVHLVGRRGPAHTRFSAPVLKELLELPGVETVIDTCDASELTAGALSAASEIPLSAREAMGVLLAASLSLKRTGHRRLTVHYWSVLERIGTFDHGLEVSLAKGLGLKRTASRLTVDAVITAIGFELTEAYCSSLPLTGGVLANQSGRMTDSTGAPIGGLYAVGWAARGANGTIGTCRSEAERLTQLIAKDVASFGDRPATGAEGLRQLLRSRHHRFVDFREWLHLDVAERANGAAFGRSRLKFRTLTQMLSSLDCTLDEELNRVNAND
jgi:ferredoxin--NADP+ reductase